MCVKNRDIRGGNMNREEKFEFDIANLKQDLAIEDMYVTEEDVALLRRYFDNEITMPEMIDIIKRTTM